MHNGVTSVKLNTGRGWKRRPDGKIVSERPWLLCPECGFQLHKLLPETKAENQVVYCRKCGKESIVNIEPLVPVP